MLHPLISVRNLLIAAPPVAALVADRVFFTVAPQSAALPHVVLIGGPEAEEYALQVSSGIQSFDVSVVVIASHLTASAEIGAAILNVLRQVDIVEGGSRLLITRDPGGAFDFVPDGARYRRILPFQVMAAKA